MWSEAKNTEQEVPGLGGAKGRPALLGIKAVIAESFETIHRSNLVGMGSCAPQAEKYLIAWTLKLKGNELISIPLSKNKNQKGEIENNHKEGRWITDPCQQQ
ncbi:MAG: hypothetical protein Q9N34_08735 [Aquificota bacterium]|nr:hypothetical protein [Aquificota bacterium]